MKDDDICHILIPLHHNYHNMTIMEKKNQYNEKQTKIHVFSNGTENKVVIRSRGGSHLMCLWNTGDNTFTKGQWLCGKKLLPDKCLYKNDGKFIYRYNQFGCDTRIVECTPPFFSAHQMWEGNCCTPVSKIITLLDRKKCPNTFTIPTTIIGKELRDDKGNLVHDFTEDKFENVAPPEDHVIGVRVKESVFLRPL